MCNKVLALCFAFVCLAMVCLCVGQEEGEPCIIENRAIRGICKKFRDCPFAQKVVKDEIQQPQTCMWDDLTHIVCCPENDSMHITGPLGRMYEDSRDGERSSRTMICYYNGYEPSTCCRKQGDVELPQETDCGELKLPKFENIISKKCAEYQRYVHRCVASYDNQKEFIREKICWGENVPRISGGVEIEINKFPHMALIGRGDPKVEDIIGVQWIGAGTLISQKFVLTAAHVLVTNEERRVRYVLLGTTNATDTSSPLLNIIHTFPHPLYSSLYKNHDIAIVELHMRVRLSEFIRPACLPSPDITIEDTTDRIIAGWGAISENGETSAILRTANVTVGEDECWRKIKTTGFVYNKSTMICAQGTQKRGSQIADPCKGDSGSPLMARVTNLDCTYVVEGVVSFGLHCGIGEGGIYTRVSYYLDWIVKTVWPDEV